MSQQVRVLVVDDSAFMRQAITKSLSRDPDLVVVGTARDGIEALEKIPALRPDVVTLDVEMPRMDGLATLQRIVADFPTPVIMLSSLTTRGARTTIQALMRGAIDFVPKPDALIGIQAIGDELIAKVKAAARTRTMAPQLVRPATPPEPGKAAPRPFHQGDAVVVIGASTGGPRAVQQVLSSLAGTLSAAVVIVQHMPSGFTRSLAQRLNEHSELGVQEAADGDRLALGYALLAPGDFHLQLRAGGRVALDQGPRRNHVRPAVDVTMESAAEHHGPATVGVVLTGMGSDGRAGAMAIKKAGGRIIAEHESTSVVYGMPRSVVEAGLADLVVPLPEIAAAIEELVTSWIRGSTATSGVKS